ncbi:ribonuclease Z [Nocardia terpenica]|uniref:ribonuclease Z n=1 Tax=Nocardia terpenica TaxID=455432 RepID=UPI001894D592|nr:ribonuclease Z [Nocardia terpenica]MBF6061851.1 ribonuclease Z [Nocardia terpenica]MBF6106348.1 ribonuclease Z [Nocardia terpenica]MBF6110271.1 ribonuclease Z [Nocardia terpenica]MBF6120892.1 ribonuclease Z [Nocardia terpenica]MBF6151607.1 ribonuclease Z [Nocardia terpenica]
MRELVVLGTASQVPTRQRNHNGYLLRWDNEGLLFDPGEGTQRQMLFAGVSATGITRICITHFHGDHCLGLSGIIARLNLDRVPHAVDVCFPASGRVFYERLRDVVPWFPGLRERPVAEPGPIPLAGAPFTLEAVPLSHRIDTFGYRLVEPDGRRMLPDRLAHFGIAGRDVGILQREGALRLADGRTVALAEVSAVRRGQRFAFVMDTRMCSGVEELAQDADMLVIESTFLDDDADLAHEFGHLTAGQAARVAADAGVRTLVLTHFSQRYRDLEGHRVEARKYFDGELVVAEDLMRVPVPTRR